ncbi:Methyl-accepting chemotaxis sensor/transducer protein [hydrothermal vent metagenome]|uniref:Methyl-accepting chemotaxis sensor/transducer protein n=1 Tax=hydrothermal vent metagenome TaxID=652676 RepID=A0A3B1BJT1_9ZZZZ
MTNLFFINNISIKTKILGLATILIMLMLGSTGFALLKINNIGTKIQAIAKQDIPLTKMLTEITVNQLEQAINFERALRYGGGMQTKNASASYYKKAVTAFNTSTTIIAEEIKQGEFIAKEAIEAAHSEQARQEFKHINSLLIEIENQHLLYEKHVREIFLDLSKGDISHAYDSSNGIEIEEEKIDHKLESLLTEIEKLTESAILTAEHDEQSAFQILNSVAIFSLIIAALISWIIIRVITRGISKAVDITVLIASGDLTQDVQVDSTDEMGKLLGALKTMQEKLRTMIVDMQQSATELAASSEEMATVTEQTSMNITNETSEITQSATAIHEMTSTVEEVSRNAAATAEAAQKASDEVLKGNDIVQQMIQSIQRLAQSAENTSAVIDQVGQNSQGIGAILDVIKGIAEQTNLLALNAAIEAARAGDQGRGFAVVADEVRTLAQRTQESTLEIEEMIEKLQSGANDAVQAMGTGKQQAHTSVEYADNAGKSLKNITTAISAMSEMNMQIATAAEEQTSVANEINQNITELNQIAEQNATAVNEMAATSDQVARMATHLQDLTTQFRIS